MNKATQQQGRHSKTTTINITGYLSLSNLETDKEEQEEDKEKKTRVAVVHMHVKHTTP